MYAKWRQRGWFLRACAGMAFLFCILACFSPAALAGEVDPPVDEQEEYAPPLQISYAGNDVVGRISNEKDRVIIPSGTVEFLSTYNTSQRSERYPTDAEAQKAIELLDALAAGRKTEGHTLSEKEEYDGSYVHIGFRVNNALYYRIRLFPDYAKNDVMVDIEINDDEDFAFRIKSRELKRLIHELSGWQNFKLDALSETREIRVYIREYYFLAKSQNHDFSHVTTVDDEKQVQSLVKALMNEKNSQRAERYRTPYGARVDFVLPDGSVLSAYMPFHKMDEYIDIGGQFLKYKKGVLSPLVELIPEVEYSE